MASIQEIYLHDGYMYTLNRTDDYGTSWYRCDLCSVSVDGTRAIEISAHQNVISDNLSSAPDGYAGGGSPYVFVPSEYDPGFLPQTPSIPVGPVDPFLPQTAVPEPWQTWLILIAVVVMILRRRYACTTNFARASEPSVQNCVEPHPNRARHKQLIVING